MSGASVVKPLIERMWRDFAVSCAARCVQFPQGLYMAVIAHSGQIRWTSAVVPVGGPGVSCFPIGERDGCS
jgi:hypothetical protein